MAVVAASLGLTSPSIAQQQAQPVTTGRVPIRTYLNQSTVARHPSPGDAEVNAILRAAEADMAAGRNSQAEAGFVRALSLLRTSPSTPPDQVDAVTSMLAFMLASAGRVAEAEPMARAIDTGPLPAAHAARQRSSLVLAIVAGREGRYAEAADRLKSLVDLALAGDDPETAGQLSIMLAAMYQALGRNQDATDAMAVSALPAGPMANLMRLRQAASINDEDAAIAAAQSLLDLPRTPEFPDSMRAYVIAERARMLTRRAGRWTGTGLAPDQVEAERSLRAALAIDLSSETPLINVGLQEALGMTLLTQASENPQSVRTLEGLSLLKTVADRREQILGRDNPAAVGSRVDYAVWLMVANQGTQALKIMDGLAARADAAPGLMSTERRGQLDVARATIMMQTLRLGDGYVTLRAAGRNLQAYALSPERRDSARQSLASHSSVFRSQVLLGFLAARELTNRQQAGQANGRR